MIGMQDIQAYLPEMEETYKHLHQCPELGFEETETSAYILKRLAEYGIEGRQVARTGILADIQGSAPGKTVAIRADMDALPIEEMSGVPYASQNAGRMHACGHDSHVTMLLGAAHYLKEHPEQFRGTVRLIFQPAEEGFDMNVLQAVCKEGGDMRGGAASMIAFGALEGVDACFALHINGSMPVGTLGVPEERFSASSDIFELTIQGKGGHGSAPEDAVDPTGALAAVIAAYNALPSREVGALDSCSLSIGAIRCGEVWNAIPDSAYVTGGLRTFSNEMRDRVFQRLKEIAEGICTAHRCTASFVRHEGYAPGICNREMAQEMVRTARVVLGEKNVTVLPKPMMGSEDVGYYFQKVPGVIGWLGGMTEAGPIPQHNPHFKIDLKALPCGMLVHIAMALDYLNR